ncbi:BPL-N domain-containing protein [Kutzneria sp. CA-103260]|uniref:BPL-N domain-containing protein n=1 Tax=Kutzneria sp. CA-103260 TaxID=2802641 RepID=UPI001BA765CE|nr:BPL-N domain-containing protein [Kutzneria sp. CA-103260]QUQ63918.1 hypothetical protein JJ691_16350 [Kutzneria sp. CA-103260]
MTPLALVYRGPATTPGCPEAVADLLRAADHGFDVRFVGPKEDIDLGTDVLASATLYAQPGGGTLGRAFRKLRRHRDEIRAFVARGGGYLGFCLGGYLAGATPGFGLLPGDTDQYIISKGATVRHDRNALVSVNWRGRTRELFFQDGPQFLVERREKTAVLAHYPNGTVAALVARFGQGRVGVVGPHPEASSDWFTDAGLAVPRPLGTDLGLDLVNAVMKS